MKVPSLCRRPSEFAQEEGLLWGWCVVGGPLFVEAESGGGEFARFR